MYKSVLQRPCEDTLHEDGSGGGEVPDEMHLYKL